jgi:hypothetical protein
MLALSLLIIKPCGNVWEGLSGPHIYLGHQPRRALSGPALGIIGMGHRQPDIAQDGRSILQGGVAFMRAE